jgi:hypothetical protein
MLVLLLLLLQQKTKGQSTISGQKKLQEAVRGIQADNSVTPCSETDQQPSASDQSIDPEHSASSFIDGTDEHTPSIYLEINK